MKARGPKSTRMLAACQSFDLATDRIAVGTAAGTSSGDGRVLCRRDDLAG
jgi:sarcosine oxidase gamma subunit